MIIIPKIITLLPQLKFGIKKDERKSNPTPYPE